MSPVERIADLRALLWPTAERELVDAFLEKTRFFVKGSAPLRFESLLPRWTLDRLLSSDLVPARRLYVLRNGDVVPPSHYRTEDGRLRKEGLAALAKEGVSFVVNGIDDDVPAIARLCDAMERRLGHTVWANAYVTHGQGGALAPHYDDHDVLVIQIEGKKTWFGHGSPVLWPITPSPDDHDFGPSVWEQRLEAGDVFYLPRGEVHHAEASGDDTSVHVTFGIEPRRGVDLLGALVETAARDPAFRQDLTRLGGPHALADQERLLKDKLHTLVEEASLTAYLDSDDRTRPLRPMPHLGSFPVSATSVVVPTVRRAIGEKFGSDEASSLLVSGASFAISPSARRVLAYLCEHEQGTPTLLSANLPGLGDLQATCQAVDELLRHGLARVDPQAT